MPLCNSDFGFCMTLSCLKILTLVFYAQISTWAQLVSQVFRPFNDLSKCITMDLSSWMYTSLSKLRSKYEHNEWKQICYFFAQWTLLKHKSRLGLQKIRCSLLQLIPPLMRRSISDWQGLLNGPHTSDNALKGFRNMGNVITRKTGTKLRV